LSEAENSFWYYSCRDAEEKYLTLVNSGEAPQNARSVLPTCTKAVIVVKANFREWRHIFQLRAIEKAAHPDMRALMLPLYTECRCFCPEIFELGDPQ
jgi:thymidylate synthase (FAD)